MCIVHRLKHHNKQDYVTIPAVMIFLYFLKLIRSFSQHMELIVFL